MYANTRNILKMPELKSPTYDHLQDSTSRTVDSNVSVFVIGDFQRLYSLRRRVQVYVVELHTHLGLTVQSDASWSSHINSINNKVCSKFAP